MVSWFVKRLIVLCMVLRLQLKSKASLVCEIPALWAYTIAKRWESDNSPFCLLKGLFFIAIVALGGL
jgi:hypothetical protein